MKPTTYTELVTAVSDYCKRSDIVAATVDYIITEAEEEMNARLRVRRQLTALTPTVSSSGAVTIPSDWRGWKRFLARDASLSWALEMLDVEQQFELDASTAGTGRPEAIVMDGSTGQIWPYTDGTYTFRALYFAGIPNLASGAPTNWLLTRYPMAYVYGCLAALAAFIKDDPRVPQWQSAFSRAIDRINEEDKMERDSRNSASLSANTTMFQGGRGFNILGG